jgi:alanyl-tRNA synthetase
VTTERLYYRDARCCEFDAQVVDITDDGRRVYLDRTAFYPTSGGQPHDTGVLGGSTVVDVVDEDDRIAHVLDAPMGYGAMRGASMRGASMRGLSTGDAPAHGATVHGVIDWRRRLDHMQQHTGQHLLSAVFEQLHGWRTASVHFGAEVSTLDLEAESVTPAQLAEAEARANDIVAEGRAVTVSFEDAATATGLRKRPPRPGVLRIISIDDTDRSACGGTHVDSTSQVGPVLLRRTERVRRTTRVEFACGSRALARARMDFESLSTIAQGFSAAIDDAAELVARQREALREAVQAGARAERELAGYRLESQLAGGALRQDGTRVVMLQSPAAMEVLRPLAQAASEHPRQGVLAIGWSQSPAAVVVAASPASACDAGALLRVALAAVGGRGGGSPRLAQGSAPDGQSAQRAAEQVKQAVLGE